MPLPGTYQQNQQAMKDKSLEEFLRRYQQDTQSITSTQDTPMHDHSGFEKAVMAKIEALETANAKRNALPENRHRQNHLIISMESLKIAIPAAAVLAIAFIWSFKPSIPGTAPSPNTNIVQSREETQTRHSTPARMADKEWIPTLYQAYLSSEKRQEYFQKKRQAYREETRQPIELQP